MSKCDFCQEAIDDKKDWVSLMEILKNDIETHYWNYHLSCFRKFYCEVKDE